MCTTCVINKQESHCSLKYEVTPTNHLTRARAASANHFNLSFKLFFEGGGGSAYLFCS